jgi:iron complex outermembrane recepter protein
MRYRVTTFVTVLVLIGHTAFAQTVTKTGTTDNSSTLEEIVVTAQKREQSANDVGISITSVGAASLERRDISSATDLVKIVPGLTVAPAGSTATVVYTLRGVGFNSINLNATSAVAVYVDEVALPYPIMTQGVGLDLERVEVDKGPQGTLFGQNSTGGAVNYIANKPTDVLSGGMDLTYGRFNWWTAKGYISGPLSDTLKVRVAFSQDGGDGWQQNYTRGATLGRPDHTQGRFLLQWDPSSQAHINLGFNGWRDLSDSQAQQLVKYSPLLPPGLPAVAAFPTAPANDRAAAWDSPEPYPLRIDSHFVQPFLRGDFELVHGLTLTSLTAYSDFTTDSSFDSDGTPYELGGELLQIGDIHDFSQELRLSGKSDSMNWVVGGNYQSNTVNEHATQLTRDLSNSQNIAGSGFSVVEGLYTSATKTNAKAGFASLDYQWTDQWSSVIGARYTDTKIGFTGCSLNTGAPIPNDPFPGVTASFGNFLDLLYDEFTGKVGAKPITPDGCATLDTISRNGQPPTYLPTDSPQTLDQRNVSWNVALDYKPIPTALLYARVAQGYKSGSFPTTGASSALQFLPAKQESLLSYELGSKLTLLDHRLQLDSSVFYYAFKNKQLSGYVLDPVLGPLVALVNVPKSRVYGVETAAAFVPVERLTVRAAVTYINTEIQQFSGFDVNGNAANFAGQRFNLAPAWTGTLDVDYRIPIRAKLTAYIGGGTTSQSETSGVLRAPTFDSSPYDIKAYTTLDLQAGIESSSGWTVGIWGKNVLNDYYWTNVNRYSDVIARASAMPAMYGVRFGYKF